MPDPFFVPARQGGDFVVKYYFLWYTFPIGVAYR